jgi:hypothetical protein
VVGVVVDVFDGVVVGTVVVGGAVVVGVVPGIVAKSGRQITSPGRSGDDAVASFTSSNEVSETLCRCAIPYQ